MNETSSQSSIHPSSSKHNSLARENATIHPATPNSFDSEKRAWAQQKERLESQLQEAIQINSRLFEKVKRLEQQLREQ
jgi:hypothetical protein